MNQYKTCRVCNVKQPVSQFSKNSRSRDLLNTRCRRCAKDYYDRNRAQILAQKSKYYKNNYDQIAEWRHNHYEKNRPRLLAEKRQFYRLNGDALRQRNRAWQRANRDWMRANWRRYARENPDIILKIRLKRRLAMKNNGVFQVRKRDVRRILNRECVFCGATERITLDHVIPLARGGRHSIGNLMPLCLSCNSSKNDKTFMEFRMAKLLAAEARL